MVLDRLHHSDFGLRLGSEFKARTMTAANGATPRWIVHLCPPPSDWDSGDEGENPP